VQVQDAAGAWISNAPDITLTDRSGLGQFPTGASITFAGNAVDKGVRDGLAAIEFRSYNAGTVTIEATSAGLASSSVTVMVRHVPDPAVPVAVVNARGRAAGLRRLASLVPFAGENIAVPGGLRGAPLHVTVYSLQGRLVGKMLVDGTKDFIRRPASCGTGLVIAKIAPAE
jgi:hypothetical protein